METGLKFFFLICGILISAALISIGIFLVRGGAFDPVVESLPAQCQQVSIEAGSAEDIAVDRNTGMAYLSVLNRRGLVNGLNVKGTILQLDLNNIEEVSKSALSTTPDGFRPHGISLLHLASGAQRLFVINHAYGEQEKIEIFERPAAEGLFTHVETLSDPLLTHPNDIAAVGPRQFYIANDSGATNAMERAGEMLFAVGLSPLVYFNGNRFSVEENNLRSSGGIFADLQRSKLYVGETMGESIRVYDLKTDRSIDAMASQISLDGAVDNIDVDTAGNLWIANHINTLALVQHFGNEDAPAPSQVQRVSLVGSSDPVIETILETEGVPFSAASVGVPYGNRVILGSITEPKVLICALD
jgi:arylesterase/paraoxonase